jgi:glucose-fructose oxidoreductase
MIAAGEIGTVTHFASNQHRMVNLDGLSEHWRVDKSLAGGGPLEDWGIYGLNGSLLLTGATPVSISATTVQPAGDPRFAEIVDLTTSEITFASGMVAQLATSYSSAFINDNLIVGTGGVIRMDPGSGYGGNRIELRKGNATTMVEAGDTSTQFVGMLNHFGDAILNGTPLITGGEMGLRDMRLIEAIYASAEQGRPIALNPDMTMKG